MADTVDVTGAGTHAAPADLAIAHATIEVRATTAQETESNARAAGDRLRTVLRDQQVPDADIKSTASAPVPESTPDGSVAYRASHTITVTIRQAETAGAFPDAVARIGRAIVGSNDARLDGIALSLCDPAPLTAQALQAALNDAHQKATRYAHLTERQLGPLVTRSDDAPAPMTLPLHAFQLQQPASVMIKVEAFVRATYALR